ncbi:MAG TPA: LPS export ABC transporter permease LptG [Candidatus Acidoferrales bacterium]|nr:LPS export ABC transporter permease LptG [Candidatus Acidoferrales bacterium]
MRIRPRLSPVMDRFIAGQFFGPFMVCLAGFTAAYLLGDMFDRFDDLIRYGGLGLLGLEYFALKLPLIVSQILPVASLAGVLLGFALLNRSGEVLACQQLGISRVEMALPVIVIAILISAFNFTISETVVPAATREAKYLYDVTLKKRQLKAVFANRRIWVRVRNGFVSADSFDSKRAELAGVTHYELDDDFGLKDLVRADGARWNGRKWMPEGLTSFQLAQSGTVTRTENMHLDLGLSPADFGLLRFDPEEFSLWDLNRYIQDLRSKGLDPGGYLVDRDLKYAMPLACLIMVALGMALSLDPLPRKSSLGRSFLLAILFGFGYWLSLGITSSLGRSGLLPAVIAAWLPNFMFAMIAMSIFLFGEER